MNWFKPRAIRITLISIVAVVVLLGLFLIYNVQRSISFSHPGEFAALYYQRDGVLEMDSDLMFSLDSGSSISTITPHDLARLKELGMKVDSTWFPALGYDTQENCRFTTKRYNVSLPAWRKTIKLDPKTGRMTLERVPGDNTTIDNVLFFPSKKGETSTIGMDILEMFQVERLTASGLLALRNSVPTGYQPLVPIVTKGNLKTFLGIECRYYVPMAIDGEMHDFFINSGINDVNVKMPIQDTSMVASPKYHDVIFQHMRPVPVVRGVAWMQTGDRAGERVVTFSPMDDNQEPYSINPSNLFDSDVIFDYPGRKLYIRPTTSNKASEI